MDLMIKAPLLWHESEAATVYEFASGRNHTAAPHMSQTHPDTSPACIRKWHGQTIGGLWVVTGKFRVGVMQGEWSGAERGGSQW